MRKTLVLLSLIVMMLMSSLTLAQGISSQVILPLSSAKLIAEAALVACTSQGFHTSVVVLDRSGNTLVVLRDELAHPLTVEMAQGKAQTAVLFRRTSFKFQEDTASDPMGGAQRDAPGVLALGGGLPIRYNGEIIGAVASSGSSQPMDDECARAGLAKAEELINQ